MTKTDIGKQRSSNQDAFFAVELGKNTSLAIVCDGMGGANAGNIASQTAVKVISDYVMNSFSQKMDSESIEKMLSYAIESANLQIYDMSLKNEALKGMGTTVVVAVLKGNTAIISHVGDSRAYKIGETAEQLTRDHSVVQSLLESGKITPADAKSHPKKNVITRALGVEQDIVADTLITTLDEGESLLLCTDGLTGYVDIAQILKIIKSKKQENVAQELIDCANNAGGGDNITVALLFR